MLDSNRKGTGDQQGLTHDVFQLADIAGPSLLLKPIEGVRLDGRGLDPQVRSVALHVRKRVTSGSHLIIIISFNVEI